VSGFLIYIIINATETTVLDIDTVVIFKLRSDRSHVYIYR